VQQYITEIFGKYLKSHLYEGALRDASRDYEINENEEKDRDRFKEQLIIIGYMGREILSISLPILAKLLEENVRSLGGHLQRIHSMPNPTQMSLSDSKILENIFEDLHWLLLISGHVLAMESDGESPLIPKEINEFSKQQLMTGGVDITATLKVLAAPNQDITDFVNAETNVDLVVRILAAVFRLCELEKGAIEAKMVDLMSPELTCTLMWFLKMFADEYLLPMPEYYDSISETFKAAFGQGPGGLWTVNYFLGKICLNVQHFSAEDTIIEDTITLFLTILRKKHRCLVVFNSEVFKAILELKNINLSVKAKRGLLKGFVLVASVIENEDFKKQYLDQIMTPIAQR
jgi:hypothetical protein